MLSKILAFLFSKRTESFSSEQISEATKIGKNIVEKILEIGSTEKPELFMFTAEQTPENEFKTEGGEWEKRWWLSDYSMLIFEEHQKIPQTILDKINAIELKPEKPAKVKKDKIELLSQSSKQYELIEEIALPAIHGALDFTNDMAFVATPLSMNVKDEKGEYQTIKDVIVTSTRETVVLDWETVKNGIKGRFRFGAVPRNLRERWSRQSVYDFIYNRNQSFTANEIFDAINEKVRLYMDLLDDREYDLVTIWCMMTYLFPIFTTLPMLYINAIRGSGKTKLITLLGCLCFSNTGKPTVNISTPSFFRTIEESRSTILIDENERLKDNQKAELRELINACYKKGSVVKRTEERLRFGNVKGFINVEFDVFTPVVMASIHSIDDVVESRCIRIGLQRTTDKIKGNRMVIQDSKEWQKIRDMLYTYVLENFDAMESKYKELHDFFVKYEPESEIKGELSNLFKLVYSRDLELWLPILSIASLISDDVMKRISSLAIDKTQARITEDITEEINNIIVESLIRSVDREDWYSLSQLISDFKEYYSEGDQKWVNTRWYSNTLKTLGLYTGSNKKRIKSGMVVFLRPQQVHELAKRLGLNIDEILEMKDKYDLDYLKEEKMSMTEKFTKALDEFGNEEIPIDELIEKVKQTGVTEFKAHEILGKLCHEGILIKPREGFVKKVTGLLKDYVE